MRNALTKRSSHHVVIVTPFILLNSNASYALASIKVAGLGIRL